MKRLLTIYEAGRVRRLHTTPHHQPYTVASHSWGMAMLLFLLYPDENPPRNLVRACLEHDVPELLVGDVPWSAKARWPFYEHAVETAERIVANELNLASVSIVEGGSRDIIWLRALDRLELLLFCLSEERLGNRALAEVASTCSRHLAESWVPAPVQEFALWAQNVELILPYEDKEPER